ncbi:MAG: hypothetical protein R3308_02650 [Thiohalobacterales bacterium]|nr:hypothetical protein [Thiohalobacterales bacterium]
MRNVTVIVLVLCMAAGLPALAASPDTDPDTGLVMAEGWETVRNNCTPCHSASLVTQNRMSRERWLETIRWMQRTQGLWKFDPATEDGILDYLESNYAPLPDPRGRRPLDVEWQD